MVEWVAVDWSSIGNIALFGPPPTDEAARTDYFESLYYSSAVVGITTSAFLEAAVVGRPVMSFFSEDLRQEHEESLHFRHLMDAQHGVLTMAGSLDEHRAHWRPIRGRTTRRSSGAATEVRQRLRAPTRHGRIRNARR
jgi:hypothetical protein